MKPIELPTDGLLTHLLDEYSNFRAPEDFDVGSGKWIRKSNSCTIVANVFVAIAALAVIAVLISAIGLLFVQPVLWVIATWGYDVPLMLADGFVIGGLFLYAASAIVAVGHLLGAGITAAFHAIRPPTCKSEPNKAFVILKAFKDRVCIPVVFK